MISFIFPTIWKIYWKIHLKSFQGLIYERGRLPLKSSSAQNVLIPTHVELCNCIISITSINTIITIIKTSSIINILNKPSTSPLSTIDIIIKITFDTPQAGRWTPTHKELETSDSQQGRISSAATHIPSKQRSYLFCQQMAFKKVVVLCI